MTNRLWHGAKSSGQIASASLKAFINDHPFPLAAALSYYALLSTAPLLLVVTSIAGLMPGDADIRGEWRDTLIGATITAVLFTLGKYLIGLYLGQASAAGSAVIFMVWVYYASLILLFGAEVTRTVARYRGHPLQPPLRT